MKDPIKIYKELKEEYFKYIETAFSVENPRFNARRKELFLSDEHKILAQDPYLELIRPYPSGGKKISDLTIADIKNADDTNYFSQEELDLYKTFCLAGLVGDYPLYQHQIEMIQNYALGKNCIITTGTGSGKTESFLLPLFAYLAKNLRAWKTNGPANEQKFDWFNKPTGTTPTRIASGKQTGGNPTYTPKPQRDTTNRSAAIKAIILYPMNALVDDQMTQVMQKTFIKTIVMVTAFISDNIMEPLRFQRKSAQMKT